MPFHLMKSYIRNPETEIKLCLCPSTSFDTDGCAVDTSAHIYARGGSFSEFSINDNLGWGTVGESFFCFCQKKIRMVIWNGELVCNLSPPLGWELSLSPSKNVVQNLCTLTRQSAVHCCTYFFLLSLRYFLLYSR